MYASTSARNPPRCVCVCVYVCVCGGIGVHACMCVWARARKPVNTCVCVSVRVRVRAGDARSAGCLCFSVRQFHFVLYDYKCVVMYYYAIAFVCEYLCIPYFN